MKYIIQFSIYNKKEFCLVPIGNLQKLMATHFVEKRRKEFVEK